MRAKYVFEAISFQRGQDPKVAMGIGQKVVIEEWFEDIFQGYPPEWRFNADGNIDLLENFEGPDKKIHKFPDFIQFGECQGDFMIDCCEMESLRGCPKKVIGYFSCEGNRLRSLEWMPTKILGDIFVRDNPGKFTEEDVLKQTEDITGRKIYSENSHTNESMNFERGGDPLDKIKIGKKYIIELYSIIDTIDKVTFTDEQIIYSLKNWVDNSSADWTYKTDKGNLPVEDLDGKIIKFKGKYYTLPEYPDQSFTKDATMGSFNPMKPSKAIPQGWDELEDPVSEAKKVYEKMDFQRGVDPKDSLQIGARSRAFPIIGLDTIYKWYEGERCGEMLNRLKNLNGEIRSNIRFFVTPDPDDPHWSDDISEKDLDPSWPLSEVRNAGYSGIRYKDIFVPFSDPIVESLEFKKGMDPKLSIGIGLVSIEMDTIADVKEVNGKWVIDTSLLSNDEDWMVKELEKRNIRYEVVKPNSLSGWPLIKYTGTRDALISMLFDMWGIDDSDLPDYLEEFKPVNEQAVSFERGQDPRVSIGIGLFEVFVRNLQRIKESGIGKLRFTNYYEMPGGQFMISGNDMPGGRSVKNIMEDFFGEEYIKRVGNGWPQDWYFAEIKLQYVDLYKKAWEKVYGK